jgi:hypothetical protein
MQCRQATAWETRVGNAAYRSAVGTEWPATVTDRKKVGPSIVVFWFLVVSVANVVVADDAPRAADTPNAADTQNAADKAESMSVLESPDGVLVSQGDQPVLFYQRTTKSIAGKWPRAGYVHPLFDLDGNVITEDFPQDHRHHRGVFWAWHQVWIGQQRVGDPWVCKDFIWNVKQVKTARSLDAVTLTAQVDWETPLHTGPDGAMIPIVRETTKIIARAASQSHRVVDFEIRLLAGVDGVRIGGSDDVKGYGGFSPRIKLSQATRFRSLDGEVEPITTAVAAGDWLDISGEQFGVAILAHPANPGRPGRWILRRRNSMQNAVYPGRDPVPLSTTDTTVLRYRLVIHGGTLSADQIQSIRQEYVRGNHSTSLKPQE